MPRVPGRGRRKTVLQPIENQAARQVCFSKRRQGLFKKAAELSVICGAQVGAIVISPAGRPYTIGTPKIGPVVDRYLSGTKAPLPPPRCTREPNAELVLPSMWDADIGTLGLEELKKYEAEMEEFYAEIEQRVLQNANAAKRTVAATEEPKATAAADVADVNAVNVIDEEQMLPPSAIQVGPGPGVAAESNSTADEDTLEWLGLYPPGQQGLGLGDRCDFPSLHL